MSAVPDGEPSEIIDGKRVHKWSQPVACSSYLIAMAVGELEKRDISDRCCVWSEPSMVDAVRYIKINILFYFILFYFIKF